MATRDDIVTVFNRLCGEHFPWKGMWISDDEWANYVQPDSTILLEKRRKDFNNAISKDATYSLLLNETKNDRGVYRHVKTVKARNEKVRGVNFYYISKDGELPPRPTDVKEWQSFFNKNLIRVSDRKRKANGAQQEQQFQRARVTPTPGAGDQETATTGQINVQAVGLETVAGVLSREEITGSFWKDKSIVKTFSDDDDDAEEVLNRRIELLGGKDDVDKLLKIVNKADERTLDNNQAIHMTSKAAHLRLAYMVALEEMPNGKSWRDSCAEAISRMEKAGISRITGASTIMKWNRQFHKAEKFPHPNAYVEAGKEPKPWLVDVFPEGRDKIQQFCLENLEKLSCVVAIHVRTVILPELYAMYQKMCENASPAETPLEFTNFLKKKLKLRKVESSTALRWLNFLGFKYCEQKKTYYISGQGPV
jgi:hypothetical protein